MTDIRQELREALDLGNFPSPSLLPSLMAQLDAPKSPRTYTWPTSIGAGALAAVLIVALVVVRINMQAPFHSDDRPAMPASSIVTGVTSYHWISPQVGWMNLSVPGPPGSTSADGLPTQRVDTVIARTVDGGRTWHRELFLTGLVWRWYEQFLSPTDAVVVGQKSSEPSATLSTTAWRTTDGGAHWSTSTLEIAPADMQALGPGTWVVTATDFLDSRRGWVLLNGMYMCGGCMTFVQYGLLYRTSDGGDHWSKIANVPIVLGVWESIRFATPDFGFISTAREPMAVTRDGGRSWMVTQRPLPQPPEPLSSEVIAEPPTLFSASQSAFGVDVANLVKVPCLDMSGHNVPLPNNVPPYCQNGDVVAVAAARYVLTSNDGGATWRQSAAVPVKGVLSNYDAQSRINFVAPHLWVVADGDGLSKSTDGGATWSSPKRIPIPEGWYVSESEFIDASHGWVTLSDNAQASYITRLKAELFPYAWPSFSMLATSDGGATWHTVSLPQT